MVPVEFSTGEKFVRLSVPFTLTVRIFNAYPFKNLNAKIEVKFLTCTVENLNGKV